MWFIPVNRKRFKVYFTIALAQCILRKKNYNNFENIFHNYRISLCAMKMNIGKTAGRIEVPFSPADRKRFKVFLTIAFFKIIVYPNAYSAMKIHIEKTVDWIEMRFSSVDRESFKVYFVRVLAPCILRKKTLRFQNYCISSMHQLVY